MAIRNWPARGIVITWAVSLVAMIGGVVLVGLSDAGGDTREARSIVVCLACVWTPAIITSRWFAGLPHARWRPPKLLFLWGCLGAAIFALHSVAQEQRAMELYYVLMPPVVLIVVVITWTWLSAREQG